MINLKWLSWPRLKIFLLLLFIFFQVYLIAWRKHDCLDLDIYPNSNVTPAIFGGNVIGQSFIAKRNGVNRVELLFSTYHRTNNKDIFFRLYEHNPQRRLLVEKVINASVIPDNLYYSIKFKPLKNTKNKKLSFEFSSPNSTLDNCVTVWMNDKNIYPPGEYLFQKQPQPGDLVFRVYSRRPISTEFGRIVRNYHGIFGHLWALIILVILFEIAQCFLFWHLLELIRRVGRMSHP